MPLTLLFANNAISTLAGALTSGSGTLTIAAGDGVKFPSPGVNEGCYITISNAEGDIEIVYVSSRTDDTFTISRSQDGTFAQAWNAGDTVDLRNTRDIMKRFVQGNSDFLGGIGESFFRVINGDMRVSQKGATALIANDLVFGGADRMGTRVTATTATGTIDQVRNASFPNTYAHGITGLETTGTTDIEFLTRLEAMDSYNLENVTVTVQMKVFHNEAINHLLVFSLWAPDVTDDYTAITQIDTDRTWDIYPGDVAQTSATFVIPGQVAARGLQISAKYASLPALSAPTNFYIADVGLELGPSRGEILRIPYALSLQMCQRYLRPLTFNVLGQCTSSTTANLISQGVPMRATPVTTITDISAYKLADATGAYIPILSVTPFALSGDGSIAMTAVTAGGLVAGNATHGESVVPGAFFDAELR